jgi:hypothetical protein
MRLRPVVVLACRHHLRVPLARSRTLRRCFTHTGFSAAARLGRCSSIADAAPGTLVGRRRRSGRDGELDRTDSAIAASWWRTLRSPPSTPLGGSSRRSTSPAQTPTIYRSGVRRYPSRSSAGCCRCSTMSTRSSPRFAGCSRRWDASRSRICGRPRRRPWRDRPNTFWSLEEIERRAGAHGFDDPPSSRSLISRPDGGRRQRSRSTTRSSSGRLRRARVRRMASRPRASRPGDGVRPRHPGCARPGVSGSMHRSPNGCRSAQGYFEVMTQTPSHVSGGSARSCSQRST